MEKYESEDTIPYDLRQIYAVELVGAHLKDIVLARKSNKYEEYFKCLKDLWIITQHKIKKIKNKNYEKEYKDLINESNKIINKYMAVYKGKSTDSVGIYWIEEILYKLEMFLYDGMEEAKLFGAKPEPEMF